MSQLEGFFNTFNSCVPDMSNIFRKELKDRDFGGMSEHRFRDIIKDELQFLNLSVDASDNAVPNDIVDSSSHNDCCSFFIMNLLDAMFHLVGIFQKMESCAYLVTIIWWMRCKRFHHFATLSGVI